MRQFIQKLSLASTNRVPMNARTLDAAPTLKLVAVAATGYDHVDTTACRSRGVAVCNVGQGSLCLQTV